MIYQTYGKYGKNRTGIVRRVLSLLIIFVLFLVFSGPEPLKAFEDDADPIDESWPVGPDTAGDGAIVIDADTGSILYEKNIYEKFYPASTTKILTTLVALENGRLDDILTVSYAADNYVSKTSSRMGLVEGEQVTVEQALYGIMLESGNEATYAVGEHVSTSIAGFIKLMNRKARELGCDRSNFANSHGLHDDYHYTCCYDMSLIARAAYYNEEFMKITGTAFYNMPATNKHEAKILTNHHWFLNGTQKYEYAIGGKTGATNQAGYALVTYARKDGMNLISVVMHAPTWSQVYEDTRKILDFCFDHYSSYRMDGLVEEKETFPSCFDNFQEFENPEKSLISIEGSGTVIVPEGFDMTKIVKKISYNNDFELENGENIIGKVAYTYGSRTLGETDILLNNSYTPITAKVFNERWPSYMVPVDIAFSGVDEEAMGKPGEKEAKELQQKRIRENAIAVGLCSSISVFIVGGIIAIIYKRKRRRW